MSCLDNRHKSFNAAIIANPSLPRQQIRLCLLFGELKRIGVRLKLTHYGTIAGEIKSLSKDAAPIENVGLVYAARVAMAQSTIRHCKTNLYRFRRRSHARGRLCVF